MPLSGKAPLKTVEDNILRIALDGSFFSTKKYLYFSYFLTKTYVVGTH